MSTLRADQKYIFRRIFGSVVRLLMLGFPLVSGASKNIYQPNILMIITDDQGIGDFGFMGNQDVKTPNLDRLAEESALFTNFVVAPACSPSRASLMTGRNHMTAGVWGVGVRNNLLRDETLMPQFFKTAGYGTGYFGKRDGVYKSELQAWENGCDEVSHVTGYVHKDALSFTHTGPVQRSGWTCDVDVETSLDYIRRQGDDPWWCTTAFILPHLPWEPDEKFAKPYREVGMSEKLADVYGCITQLDDAVGRLLAGLEALGQRDNTIVILLSDNGPSYKGMSDADIASRDPLGLQGSKTTVWENGIRVPLLVRWPGHIEPGLRSQFATVEDVLPTLLDLTGVSAAVVSHLPFDGISMKAMLLNPEADGTDRQVFRVAISGEGAAGGKSGIVNDPLKLPMDEQHVVLRGPRFKLHQFAGGATALYDLDADLGETNDVSAAFPEVAERYRKALEKQYREIVESGRAYRLPYTKIRHRRGSGYNKIYSGSALRIEGGIRPVGFSFVKGFSSVGDRVEYEIDVEETGSYEVSISGVNLLNGKGWRVETGGRIFLPVRSEASLMQFDPVELSAGRSVISISTTDAGSLPAPFPKEIVFHLKP